MSIVKEIAKIIKDSDIVVSEVISQFKWSYESELSLLSFIISPSKKSTEEIIKKIEISNNREFSLNLIQMKGGTDLISSLQMKDLNIIVGLSNQPEIVRKLNWSREKFISGKFRCLFIITYFEYFDLIERAPDFWDFRNSMSFTGSEDYNLINENYSLTPKIIESISPERQEGILDVLRSSKEHVDPEIASSSLRLATLYTCGIKQQDALEVVSNLASKSRDNANYELYKSLQDVFDLIGSGKFVKTVLKIIKSYDSYDLTIVGYTLISRHYFYNLGDEVKSAKYLRKVFELSIAEKDLDVSRIVLDELRNRYLVLSEPQEALKIIEKFRSIGSKEDDNLIVLLKADIYIRILDLEKAFLEISKYDDSYDTSNYKLVYGFLLCLYYFNSEEYKLAEQEALRCMEISKEILEYRDYVFSCNNATRAAIADKNYFSARRYLDMASQMLKFTPESASNFYCTLAGFQQSLGRYDTALKDYKYALSLAARPLDRLFAISSIIDTSDITDLIPEDEIEQYISQGKSISRTIVHADSKFRFILNAGVVYSAKKEYIKSEKYLKEAYNYYKEGGNRKNTLILIYHLSISMYHNRKYKEAHKMLKEVEEMANNLSDFRAKFDSSVYIFIMAAKKHIPVSSEQALKKILDFSKDVEVDVLISAYSAIYDLIIGMGRSGLGESMKLAMLSYLQNSERLSTEFHYLERMKITYLDARLAKIKVVDLKPIIDIMGEEDAVRLMSKFGISKSVV